MSKLIKQGNKPFTQVPREIIDSRTISLKAKGLYTFMAGKPDNWNFTISSMASQLSEGANSINKGLIELKDTGWIVYIKDATGKGHYIINWTAAPVGSPDVRKPHVDNRDALVIKSISNKDSNSNTKHIKKKVSKVSRISKKELITSTEKERASNLINDIKISYGYDYISDKLESAIVQGNMESSKIYNTIVDLLDRSQAWRPNDRDIKYIHKFLISPINEEILDTEFVIDRVALNIESMLRGNKPTRFGNSFVGLKEMKANIEQYQ